MHRAPPESFSVCQNETICTGEVLRSSVQLAKSGERVVRDLKGGCNLADSDIQTFEVRSAANRIAQIAEFCALQKSQRSIDIAFMQTEFHPATQET